MEFVPITCNNDSYDHYIRLFKACFPASPKFVPHYLDWLYRQNPEGKVVGFDAWEKGKLAAHYASVPAQGFVEGRETRLLLSFGTATHPDFQGQGLFTKLAQMTYEAAANQGFEAIYGVANANSTPGFCRKLNFTLVSQLSVKIGIGIRPIDFSGLERTDFYCRRSSESLKWRCQNPINPIRVYRRNGQNYFMASALMAVPVIAQYPNQLLPDDLQLNNSVPSRISPFRLSLGLTPKTMQKKQASIEIPQFMRPSPLNLIYLSLTNHRPTINPESVFFTFMDFDAF
ncbi:MAG: GNAT family N-acetyltransferase [Candidatus Pacebacteria bacterium]|nr:GNAT family N-acetyltransferase [Candidatus Paceibacterota bacterium]